MAVKLTIRQGHMTIHESYVRVIKSEVPINANILPYSQGNRHNLSPNRDRKLLLHKRQINQLIVKTEQKGFALIPTKVYFKNNRVKLEIGVGKSKKKYDKRADIKKRELDRQIQRRGRAQF